MIRRLAAIAALLCIFAVAHPAAAQNRVTIANSSSTGTTLGALTKLTGAPAKAVISATTDTGGIIGITVAGAGTSGSAVIQTAGIANCIFDAATTAGHYVQISSTTAGDCHDAGSSYPSGGELIGRVLTTNGAGGTYSVLISEEVDVAAGGACPTCASQSGIQQESYIYGAGGGTANAQTLTLSPALGSYVAGAVVAWLPVAANTTSTPTLNVNSLGATTIVKAGGTALAANDLTTSAVAVAIYDGSHFELQNPQTGNTSLSAAPVNPITSSFRTAGWNWTASATNTPPTADQYAAFGGTGANSGCATSSVPPCITQGNAQGYQSALNWIVGQNILFEESGQLTTLSSTCVTIDVNSNNNIQESCTTLGSLQNNASFLFGGTLETTDWGCVTANGSARQITTSTIAADTNPHVFTIQFNDSVPNVVFSIDGTVACTVTTDVPATGSVMGHAFYVGGTVGGLYREFSYYMQSGNSW